MTWIRSHPWWTLLALLAVLALVWLWASGLLISIEYESQGPKAWNASEGNA